jgi:hypothetical protein
MMISVVAIKQKIPEKGFFIYIKREYYSWLVSFL